MLLNIFFEVCLSVTHRPAADFNEGDLRTGPAVAFRNAALTLR